MNFPDATKAAARGARIKRDDWESYLVQRKGRLVWDLPESLLRQCNQNGTGDPTYRPTEIDENATDWGFKVEAKGRAA